MNIAIAAATATVPAIVVIGGPPTTALAGAAPVCGPQVQASFTNNSSSPLSLTVPQYSGALSAASISIEATATFQNEFLSPTTFQPGPGDATAAYIGEAQVLQATGPGLSALADVAPGIAYNYAGRLATKPSI